MGPRRCQVAAVGLGRRVGRAAHVDLMGVSPRERASRLIAPRQSIWHALNWGSSSSCCKLAGTCSCDALLVRSAARGGRLTSQTASPTNASDTGWWPCSKPRSGAALPPPPLPLPVPLAAAATAACLMTPGRSLRLLLMLDQALLALLLPAAQAQGQRAAALGASCAATRSRGRCLLHAAAAGAARSACGGGHGSGAPQPGALVVRGRRGAASGAGGACI